MICYIRHSSFFRRQHQFSLNYFHPQRPSHIELYLQFYSKSSRRPLPFEGGDITETKIHCLQDEEELRSLCYFPSLSRVRIRRYYEADRDRKAIICTKKEFWTSICATRDLYPFLPPWFVSYTCCTKPIVLHYSHASYRILLWFPGNETLWIYEHSIYTYLWAFSKR